jgi:hypothetical protein
MRYALALVLGVEIGNTLSRNRIPYHIERSILFANALKADTGLSSGSIGERIRRTAYAPISKLSEAPSPHTVSAYLSGKRPIPFDPPGSSTPSWLMAAEYCFPGSSRYFFHPIFNLLAGRIESSEKTRARNRRIPDAWAEQASRLGQADEAAEYAASNAKFDSRARVRVPRTAQDESLDWIHANMYALVPEARNTLLKRSGLALGWRRAFHTLDHEIATLGSLPALEALAAALALHLEANVIRDAERSEASRRFVIEQLARLKSEAILRRVAKLIAMSVTDRLSYSSFARYDPEWIAIHTLPDSWRGLASHLIRQERFENFVARGIGGSDRVLAEASPTE